MSSINKHKILANLASLKITVACLILFMVITILGTLYQVDHGINEARETFFSSWFIMFMGGIPFPGGQLILWIFAVNLLSSCFTKIGFRLNKLGIWLSHIGLLVLCFSAFYTYIFSVEGRLQLVEGESSQFAQIDDKWELAVWFEKNGSRFVTSYPVNSGSQNDMYTFEPEGIDIQVKKYYENSTPLQSTSELSNYSNDSGITDMKMIESGTTGMDAPGIFIDVSNDELKQVLLYGREINPTSIKINNLNLFFQLRPQCLKLPAEIELVDVEQQLYEGTGIAKSYESRIKLKQHDSSREARIL